MIKGGLGVAGEYKYKHEGRRYKRNRRMPADNALYHQIKPAYDERDHTRFADCTGSFSEEHINN